MQHRIFKPTIRLRNVERRRYPKQQTTSLRREETLPILVPKTSLHCEVPRTGYVPDLFRKMSGARPDGRRSGRKIVSFRWRGSDTRKRCGIRQHVPKYQALQHIFIGIVPSEFRHCETAMRHIAVGSRRWATHFGVARPAR
jgi:hypothetical protein